MQCQTFVNISHFWNKGPHFFLIADLDFLHFFFEFFLFFTYYFLHFSDFFGLFPDSLDGFVL